MNSTNAVDLIAQTSSTFEFQLLRGLLHTMAGALDIRHVFNEVSDVVRGGPNGVLSLTQARANYLRFGASDERFAISRSTLAASLRRLARLSNCA